MTLQQLNYFFRKKISENFEKHIRERQVYLAAQFLGFFSVHERLGE